MGTYQMARKALFHPLDFFYDIQFLSKSNKLTQALIIIGLTIAVRLFSLIITGFAYQKHEPDDVSVVIQAVWIIIPWLTWAFAGWGVSSIVDGEGKFIDVLASSSFVFVPYIVMTIPITLLSIIITLQEKSIYVVLTWLMYIWIIYLVFVHVKIIHDFDMAKTLWITGLTIAGMFIIWFMVLLIFGLANQVFRFVIVLFKEITFRM